MDTAGKGGILKHVIGAVDPQGVQLAAFKKPTDEELEHDFLWRVRKEVPEEGKIGVFDRSHYEDVLIARVRELAPPEEIERRYAAINEFEAELVGEGTNIIKVMLHISPDEQKKRLLDRLERPEKQWKYNPGDVDERMLGPKYKDAYQIAFDRTSTPIAPWYVVPADRKWYARLAVQHLLIEALRGPAAGVAEARLRRRGREGAAHRELTSGGRYPPKASTIGRNFMSVSASSSAGTESCTMPQPAYAATAPIGLDLRAAQRDRPFAVAVAVDPAHGARVTAPVEALELGEHRKRGEPRGTGDRGRRMHGADEVERARPVAERALEVGREVPQVRQLQRERLGARVEPGGVRLESLHRARHGEGVLGEVLGRGRQRDGSLAIGCLARAS